MQTFRFSRSQEVEDDDAYIFNIPHQNFSFETSMDVTYTEVVEQFLFFLSSCYGYPITIEMLDREFPR